MAESPTIELKAAPKTPERQYTREHVIQAFNGTFHDYRARPGITPEDQIAIDGIQTAKAKTIDKGQSRSQNKFPDAVTGEQIVTLEGVPIDRLLVFLESKIDSGLLSDEDLAKYKDRWDVLNANKKPFLHGKQLNPNVRLSRNQQEAYLISQDARNVPGEVNDWYKAEVELNRRFELVLPPKPKAAEPSPTPRPRLVGGEESSESTPPPMPKVDSSTPSEGAPPPVLTSETTAEEPPTPSTVEDVCYEVAMLNRTLDMSKSARETANKFLNEKLKGRNIFRRIKYRLAEEYYRQKFTRQAYSAMMLHHNAYLTMECVGSGLRVLDADAGRTNEKDAADVKISELQGRLEARMRTEDSATAEGTIKQQLLEVIIQPVLNGTLTEPQQVQHALAAFIREHAGDPTIAQFFGSEANTWGQASEYFATDLLDMGREIKADYDAHGQSMEWLDQHLNIRLASPTWAVEDENQKLSRTDKFIKWAQSRRLTGAIFNPAVVGAMSSIATFGILRAPLRAATTIASIAAPGAGALSGGLFAAFRRSHDAKVDRATHNREMARGMQIPLGSKQRERMERFAYDRASVQDLINGGGVDSQRDNQPRRSIAELVASDLTVESNQQDLVSRIAEIEARDVYSFVNKVNLITFESGESIEQGRLALVDSVIAGKRALRNAGVDESRIAVMSAALTHHFETDQADKDKAFKRFRIRSSLANGAFGSVAGLASGLVVQEGVALGMRASGNGVGPTFLERAVGYDGSSKTVDVFRDLAGKGGSYDVGADLRFNVDPTNHNVQITDIATGKPLADVPIRIGDDGSMFLDGKMPPELQTRLQEANFDVLDRTGPPQEITRVIDVPGTPTTTTEVVGGPQAVEQWRQVGTHYDQQQWYRNDTAGVYELNEHRAYTIKQGDTLILDMSRMQLGTESGLTPNPIDVQNVIQSNEAGFSFKIPGGGHHQTIWIPESADGVADGLLHLDPNDTAHMVTMGDGSQMSIAELSKMIVNQDELARFKDGDIGTEYFNRREVFNLGNNGRKGWWEVGRMTDQNGKKVLQTFATGRGASDAVGVKTTEIPGIPTTKTVVETIPGKTLFEIVPPTFTEPHDPIPLIPIPFAPRYPLEPLSREAEFMYGYGLAGGGIISADRRAEFERRRSKTLQTNPKAVLDAREEARVYLDAQPEPYRRSLEELAAQITVPASENLKIAVCIPVAGHQEGGNIYTTLDNYRYQDMPTDQFELILFVNHPRVDNAGKAVVPDNTLTEIERFKRDHPDFPVRVISKVLEPEDANIGKIRKILADTTLVRTIKRTSTGDVIFVSNDADMKGASPTYLSTFVNKFEANPEIDGLLGQLDWDPEGYIEHPAVHIGTRLFQYLGAKGRIATHRAPSSGASFAFRSSIYSAIGGYSENLLGEDIALGEAILVGRSTNRDEEKGVLDGLGRIKYAGGGTRLYTSARRAIDSLRKGLAPLEQWDNGFSLFDDEIRKMKLGEGGSIDYSDAAQVERVKKSLSWVIDRTVSVWDSAEGIGKDHEYYRRALGFLGVSYDVVGGKIVVKDFSKLLEGLKRYQTEGLALRDRKSGKGGVSPRTPIEIVPPATPTPTGTETTPTSRTRPTLPTETPPTTTAESTVTLAPEAKYVVGKSYVSESGRTYEVTGVTVKPNGTKLILYKFAGQGLEGKGNFSEGKWNEYIDGGRLKPLVATSESTAESTADLGERINSSKGAFSTEASEFHPTENQDSVVVDTDHEFIGVFDGVGGEYGGDVASRIAMEQTRRALSELPKTATRTEIHEAVRQILTSTFSDMQAHIAGNPDHRKMATTGSIAKIFEEDGKKRVMVLHAGDSRLYIVRKDGAVTQITRDHSKVLSDVEKGIITPEQGAKITRELDYITDISSDPEGIKKSEFWDYFIDRNEVTKVFARGEAPDYNIYDLPDDVQYILATSDGVHDNLTKDTIALACAANKTPRALAEWLVQEAKAKSSIPRTNSNIRVKPDDTTAAVLAV